MDVLMHKALSPPRHVHSPEHTGSDEDGVRIGRGTKEAARPSSPGLLHKALERLGKAKARSAEGPEGSYVSLPGAEKQVLSPPGRGILRRNPGLENAVPQGTRGSHVTGKPPPVPRKGLTRDSSTLEDAQRQYERVQQELVLAQGAVAKKEEQIRLLARSNGELSHKMAFLEKSIDGLHAGYRREIAAVLEEAKKQQTEGAPQQPEASGSRRLVLEPISLEGQADLEPFEPAWYTATGFSGPEEAARALDEARARIAQLEKELHESLQMALLPPSASFPLCSCRVDQLADQEVRSLHAAALSRLASVRWPKMSEDEEAALLQEAVNQERMATVVHMKDKFFQSEAKRKRAEEAVEAYVKKVHHLEQQLRARAPVRL